MPEVAERSTVEILKAARERITPVEAWTTGTYARSENLVRVRTDSARACQFCGLGALYAEGGVDPDNGSLDAEVFLYRAAKHYGYESIASLNDEGGHDQILAGFDFAIHLAEQEATK